MRLFSLRLKLETLLAVLLILVISSATGTQEENIVSRDEGSEVGRSESSGLDVESLSRDESLSLSSVTSAETESLTSEKSITSEEPVVSTPSIHWDESIGVNEDVSYQFDEKLTLRPLPNNFLQSSFMFEMNSTEFTPGVSSIDFDKYSHYTVFPKVFNSILHTTSARKLQIRFTRGFWDAESWGRLPHDGFKAGGSGVELWAVIEADSKEDAYLKWKKLANLLGGIFCASLNFIDSSKTTFPHTSIADDFELPLFDSNKQLFLLRAALANEPVCTENLTPFVKLLPTKGKSGISTLLDGHKVFDSYWHSLSIDISTRCDATSNICYDHMEANVDVVLHVPSTLSRNEMSIPKPVSGDNLRCDETKFYDAFHCFPKSESTETSYLISKIYGRQLKGSNLISNHPSRVCADVSEDWNILIELNGEYFATDNNCFDLTNNAKNDIYFESSNTTSISKSDDVPVFVSRSLISYGNDRGGLRTVFRNPTNKDVRVKYLEALPWFMRVFLSTMKLETGDEAVEKEELRRLLSSMHYLPAIDRKRPTNLEYDITIPAFSTYVVSYQFEKTLLEFAEYPPDANHGFEVESAVITVVEPVNYQIRTSTLLLVLSTPDFSMPYNVIILSSTVMGLIFGTLFNLLVKRLLTIEEADRIKATSGPKYKLRKLKEKLLSKFAPRKKD
ncbi:hypothetical protein Kpol_1067p7 [Vanderwaltozyma polyspora DSM 70294]|uniref:GPI transamidase component GPI16 n=1 Tax=Vanderwaltozyma polyspora (strain ATCC 22028 / DSM 70294 / BCRC 21397 / CBS 2163 / NBRC 10782 / NRRL Y-8283 / UCD 57-17) TaxID=436907 RepID=A7TNV2_VANPO|nr:uncharacterized protein Kpol_1067p7 [Vanderwaltozyma polyspora DSM 70294]EDO16035.1 hypothetical protein Kpol_1067p7 [Vanderwaltozyma polyspora DSM 70294]